MRVILTIGVLAMLPLGAAEPPPQVAKGRIAPVVNIGGQVRHPGPLAWRKNLAISDAILEAGGATQFGSLRRVKVLRNGTATAYDLNDEKAKMIPVLPDDTIEIPQKNLFGR